MIRPHRFQGDLTHTGSLLMLPVLIPCVCCLLLPNRPPGAPRAAPPIPVLVPGRGRHGVPPLKLAAQNSAAAAREGHAPLKPLVRTLIFVDWERLDGVLPAQLRRQRAGNLTHLAGTASVWHQLGWSGWRWICGKMVATLPTRIIPTTQPIHRKINVRTRHAAICACCGAWSAFSCVGLINFFERSSHTHLHTATLQHGMYCAAPARKIRSAESKNGCCRRC